MGMWACFFGGLGQLGRLKMVRMVQIGPGSIWIGSWYHVAMLAHFILLSSRGAVDPKAKTEGNVLILARCVAMFSKHQLDKQLLYVFVFRFDS